MINLIETYVKKKFKGWPAYEKAAGIPARHGKRRMNFYILRLNNILKPLGLKIKIEEDE